MYIPKTFISRKNPVNFSVNRCLFLLWPETVQLPAPSIPCSVWVLYSMTETKIRRKMEDCSIKFQRYLVLKANGFSFWKIINRLWLSLFPLQWSQRCEPYIN